LISLTVTACTGGDDEKLPSESKYDEESTLMANMCKKLSEEPDAKKLHDISRAIQDTRFIACANYNNECNLYGSFLTLAIAVSKDGAVKNEDRDKLRSQCSDLRNAVQDGQAKLHEAWKKKNAQAK
jgi:hypothetical protein